MAAKKEKKKEYISKSGLKDRGWTDILIKKFLPKHDKEATNPYYKCASPMKLYLLKKVNKIESSQIFQTAFEKAKIRKGIAKKVVESKRAKAIKFAKDVEIKVPLMDRSELLDLACRNYYYHKIDFCSNCDFLTLEEVMGRDMDFHERNARNYLRHVCTKYEDYLYKLEGKVGVQEAHDILKMRINMAIHEVYDWIPEED